MELEDLKKDWNEMEERLGRLEMENRQLQHKAVKSKVEQMRKRLLLRQTFFIICLPLLSYQVVRHSELDFSALTWGLMFLFIVVLLIRQIVWRQLLKKVDCVQMTVREACLAENRFRFFFKIGVAVSAFSAIPLLVSMIWDIAGMGDQYMLIGAWTGLVVGLLLGIRIFLKAWRGVKELREAIADLEK
ncbi:hypothetical protein [Bacteroides sp.]|uniref:hypothetical protein n=1 Tax=Bacteroides sp. TaxID=29523 RepID=UPI003AB6632C